MSTAIEEEVTEPKALSMSSPFVTDRSADETVSLCVGEGKPCIHGEQVGYRVLHTQARGAVLNPPLVVGYTYSFFNADELLRKYRDNGSYAILTPLYTCGHDHEQWNEYWR